MASPNPKPAGGERRVRRGEKVYETVARDIIRRIQAGQLEPGTLLPSEAQMVAEYNVGRASLREALRVLEVNGLITIKPGPGGGPVVAGVDSGEFGRMATLYFQAGRMTFRELMEARLVMEPVMARLAAQRSDPEAAAELARAVAAADAADVRDDVEYLGTSADLHEAIAGMSGNRILNLFGRALLAIFYERVGGMLFPTSRREGVRRIHADIAQAIVDGDADRAETLMREHMVEYANYTRRRYPALQDEIVDWR
jgi:DNA-binding FadR family transcriptional regulator